jgi:hypothetical protein
MGFCEHGYESSDAMKAGNFLTNWETASSMELVRRLDTSRPVSAAETVTAEWDVRMVTNNGSDWKQIPAVYRQTLT